MGSSKDLISTRRALRGVLRLQLLKRFGEQAHVDIIDRLPTPFGLVRSGVAPDHQDTKVTSCSPSPLKGIPNLCASTVAMHGTC